MALISSNRASLEARARLKQVIREFFSDYLEVDTPIVVPCPGVETYLRYIEARLPAGDMGDMGDMGDRSDRSDKGSKSHSQNGDTKRPAASLWLRSSPELACKQLMSSADTTRLFELGPCFRAGRGEFSPWHHPEFWLLEWYRQPCSFDSMLAETEDLLVHCFRECSINSEQLTFVHLSVYECFQEFMGIELVDEDVDLAQQLINAGLYSVQLSDDFETAFFKALLEVCEPRFKTMSAVVLYDYPPSQGVLAQRMNGRAKRAETYIHGIEVTNGCLEMSSQSAHLAYQAEVLGKRRDLGYESPELGEDFLASTEVMAPDMAGVACGFERLLALLQQQPSLDSQLPFRYFYSS